MRRMLAAALLLLGATSVQAQPFESAQQYSQVMPRGAVAASGADCAGGLRYDDGTFEDGYRYGTIYSGSIFGMRFDFPPGKKKITAVCGCWAELLSNDGVLHSIYMHRADGPGGVPGSRAGVFGPFYTTGLTSTHTFYRYDIPDFEFEDQQLYIGPGWIPAFAGITFLCMDENGPTSQPGFSGNSLSSPPNLRMGAGGQDFFDYKNMGVRVEYELIIDPDPPAGAWITTTELPGYQFKARITAGANVITPAKEPCQEDTLCLSGALPGRSELYARIIGPRPNGFLWVNLVRFTTSQVEVWVERISDGELRYYKLPAIPGDSSDLSGLVDKTAFQP